MSSCRQHRVSAAADNQGNECFHRSYRTRSVPPGTDDTWQTRPGYPPGRETTRLARLMTPTASGEIPLKTLITVLITLALAAPALAHDDAALDAMPSANGGQIRMAGPYHFELVLGENEVSLYLTDHAATPVPSEGVAGNVILMSGERSTIAIAPTGDNRLAGRGAFERSPDLKAVVSLTFPDGNTWQARFTPDAAGVQGPSVPVDPETLGDDHARHH